MLVAWTLIVFPFAITCTNIRYCKYKLNYEAQASQASHLSSGLIGKLKICRRPPSYIIMLCGRSVGLTVEHGKERVLCVVVEGIHHAAPVLVDLCRHAIVIVTTAAVARFHAVARVGSHLQVGTSSRASCEWGHPNSRRYCAAKKKK